jgi:hypothetical protein
MRKKAPCYKTRTRKIKMTIYNPFGLQLIIMESKTKKAREFKIAAAQVVWAFITGKLFELNSEQLMAEQILEMQDKTEKNNKTKMLDLYCEKSGYSKATAYRHLKKVKKGESPQDKKYRNANKPIISGDLELEIRRMWLEDKNQGYKKIYKRLGSPKSPEITAVKDFLRKLKKDDMMGKLASKEWNDEDNKNKKNKK